LALAAAVSGLAARVFLLPPLAALVLALRGLPGIFAVFAWHEASLSYRSKAVKNTAAALDLGGLTR
jgi:hypothetical protein